MISFLKSYIRCVELKDAILDLQILGESMQLQNKQQLKSHKTQLYFFYNALSVVSVQIFCQLVLFYLIQSIHLFCTLTMKYRLRQKRNVHFVIVCECLHVCLYKNVFLSSPSLFLQSGVGSTCERLCKELHPAMARGLQTVICLLQKHNSYSPSVQDSQSLYNQYNQRYKHFSCPTVQQVPTVREVALNVCEPGNKRPERA